MRELDDIQRKLLNHNLDDTVKVLLFFKTNITFSSQMKTEDKSREAADRWLTSGGSETYRSLDTTELSMPTSARESAGGARRDHLWKRQQDARNGSRRHLDMEVFRISNILNLHSTPR